MVTDWYGERIGCSVCVFVFVSKCLLVVVVVVFIIGQLSPSQLLFVLLRACMSPTDPFDSQSQQLRLQSGPRQSVSCFGKQALKAVRVKPSDVVNADEIESKKWRL